MILATSILTAALAGLLFGFDTAVIAGVTGDLTHRFALSPEWLGVTVSAALWGTLIGALLAGRPGDRYGSRDVMRVLAGFYVVAGIGCALADSWWAFVGFRFLCGLAIGGSSVLAPIYIAEIAPPSRRGLLVGLFQLNIVLGILVAYLSNAVVGALDLGDLAWRWKLGVTAAPASLLLLLLYRIPNSPRWLVARGRSSEAAASLALISNDRAAAVREISAIEAELAAARSAERLSWSRHRRPILLAVSLATFNQLAGINAILYYLNDILGRAGSVSADRQAVAIGLANLMFTIVGMLLIDWLGRRTLLAVGAAGMTVCLSVAAGVLFGVVPQAAMLGALIGFIAFFATSQGAVIWVYLSEVFPTPVRARGSGLGASTHWLMNAVVAGVFPMAVAWSAGAPFVFFAAMMALQLVVVLRFFPETKGVRLEDMAARMQEPA